MIKLCGIALFAGIAAIILSGSDNRMSKLLSLAAALILLITAINSISPVISELSSLISSISSSELSEYAATLLRALGIAYATELTSEVCRTCGADSTAVGISIVGRAELAVIAAGFLFKLLSLSLSFL